MRRGERLVRDAGEKVRRSSACLRLPGVKLNFYRRLGLDRSTREQKSRRSAARKQNPWL